MGFKQNFSFNDLKDDIRKKREAFELSLIDEFRATGELFIRSARSKRTYKDQTGNLRSAIGYSIFRDGVLIEDSFPGGDITGSSRTLAEWVAQKYNKGIVLIVTDGMHYAQYVEAKGYDVISGSGYSIAEPYIKERVKKLFEMLNRRK